MRVGGWERDESVADVATGPGDRSPGDRSLSASDPEPLALGEVLDLADEECARLWSRLSLGYSETPGNALLRLAIAEQYEQVAADEVLVCSGADEALFVCLRALADPGDHLVVVTPAYGPLRVLADMIGAHVTEVPLDVRGPWALDLDRLADAVRPTTRAVVVNFPNNPTGALPPASTLSALLRLAEDRGLHVLSDEVYRLLEYDKGQRWPAAVDRSVRGLSVGVMSKAYGLAGVNIGWVAARDPRLRRRISTVKQLAAAGNSVTGELLALIGLRAGAALLGRTHAIIARNLELMRSFMEAHRDTVSWVPPQAGTVAFPRLTSGDPAEGFTAALLEREGVVLPPGSAFGLPGPHFRVGLGRLGAPAALEQVGSFLAERARPRPHDVAHLSV